MNVVVVNQSGKFLEGKIAGNDPRGVIDIVTGLEARLLPVH